MLVELEAVSKTFCTPSGHLLKALAVAKKGTKRHNGSVYVELLDVAIALRCPLDVAELVAQGKEWLLTDADLERLYGFTDKDIRNIIGGPTFVPKPFAPVYRVSPVLNWLKTASPLERAHMQEGIVSGRSKPQVSRAGLRGEVRRSRENYSSRRDRSRKPE